MAGHKQRKESATIIFLNENKVLLFLRDNKPDIPFPNYWDLPGGHVEKGETPTECIVREMEEEIEYKLENPILYKIYQYKDNDDHVFYKLVDEDLSKRNLREGQDLRWYSIPQIEAMPVDGIAFGYQIVILEFYDFWRRRGLIE